MATAGVEGSKQSRELMCDSDMMCWQVRRQWLMTYSQCGRRVNTALC